MDKEIQCPFFRDQDRKRRRIRCEGVGEAAYIEARYNSSAAMRKQMRLYCTSLETCRYCEIYRMIQEKYD